MNCCSDYGDCQQGRDCPVRKERMAEPSYLPEILTDVLITLAAFCVVAVIAFSWGYLE